MKIFTLTLVIAIGFLTSCKTNTKKSTIPVVPRDTTVTAAVAYSNFFLDSAAMEKFIIAGDYEDSTADKLRSFYNGRNYQSAWFFKEGIAECASTFYEMYNDYIGYSGDSALYNPRLRQLYDSVLSGNLKTGDSLTVITEFLFTTQFFNYATRAYQGSNQLDTKELDWFIPRKKIDPIALLDSLLVNKGKNVAAYEPINPQYNQLKQQLLKYYAIEKEGGWQEITTGKRSPKVNDTASFLPALKKRLLLTGDLEKADTTNVFTKELEDGIKNFKGRYGMKEDGSISVSFMNEINTPVQDRLQQILINMERIRWMPAQPTTDYLLINIPEYRLHVYEKGNYAWSMNVVTGSTVHSTVIFSGAVKFVVFSPYWNVTPSIIKNEILPGIARNKNYLANHNMEWNNGAVRQKPGPKNSLGLVKFLFPNSYNIYLHDTPSKSLFGESTRAFSHGCIRLAEPKKLAQYLLRNDAAWDSVKITTAMNAGKEKYVTLKETIPVFIGYFTAWVDRAGKLNFRNDIYGHDKKMKARLFKK